jgi:serine/threonine protein kinase
MPTTDALTGSRLADRYRIIYRIGEGGMGVAYRAWDCATGRPVVLKCPKKEMLIAPGFRERFEREASMLAGLVHDHIVPIIDLGTYEGLPYFVMPYLPGGSLANRRLRDAQGQVMPMMPATLQLWLPQVAAALDHVHAAGVVHRDVKPGNVFFNSGWHAYLGDFGIAKSTLDLPIGADDQPLTATNMTIGTPDYMAPELFAPKAEIDGRVDQYALAVVAYEILAGRRPFVGDSAHIVVEVMTYPTPPLSTARLDLPRSLEQAIYKALSKNPNDRFPDCWAFACAALADVAPAIDEPGVARLLCPNSDCNNNLKLPTSAAGQKGKCPRCSSQMIIAPDLSALWLVREEANEPITPADSGRAAGRKRNDPTGLGSIGDSLQQQPSSMRRMLLWAGLLASIFFGAILVSQISSARERLEHSRTAGALRVAEEKNKALEEENKNLNTAKAALERENAALREAE